MSGIWRGEDKQGDDVWGPPNNFCFVEVSKECGHLHDILEMVGAALEFAIIDGSEVVMLWVGLDMDGSDLITSEKRFEELL